MHDHFCGYYPSRDRPRVSNLRIVHRVLKKQSALSVIEKQSSFIEPIFVVS